MWVSMCAYVCVCMYVALRASLEGLKSSITEGINWRLFSSRMRKFTSPIRAGIKAEGIYKKFCASLSVMVSWLN